MQRYEVFAVCANNQSKTFIFHRFNWFKASIQYNLSVHTSPNNMPDKVISIYLGMYIVYTWAFILYILGLLYYIYLSGSWAVQWNMFIFIVSHHSAPISKQAQSLFSTHHAPSLPRLSMLQLLPFSEDINCLWLPRLLSHVPMLTRHSFYN